MAISHGTTAPSLHRAQRALLKLSKDVQNAKSAEILSASQLAIEWHSSLYFYFCVLAALNFDSTLDGNDTNVFSQGESQQKIPESPAYSRDSVIIEDVITLVAQPGTLGENTIALSIPDLLTHCSRIQSQSFSQLL